MTEPTRLLIIPCGTVPIHWLPRGLAISDGELHSYLLDEERQKAASFKSERRRLEYMRSRYLARKLSGYTKPLPAGIHGNPSWPEDWVGSLTHKDGYVGVALLPRSNWLSVGIDAEDPSRMREEFSAKIASAQELAYLRSICANHGWPLTLAMTLLFSFKESIFKAHFPLGQKSFYFHDASIVDIAIATDDSTTKTGSISAIVHVETSPFTPAGCRVDGFFCEIQSEDRRFILTSVAMPRPP